MVLGGAARVVAVADDAGRGVVAGDGEDTLRRGDGDVGGTAAFEGGLADPGAGDLHGFGRVEAVRGAEREAAGGGEVFADAELARVTPLVSGTVMVTRSLVPVSVTVSVVVLTSPSASVMV